MNTQGTVQATKAGIESHLSQYLQSMPAIVSLVNSHGLFAFYPVLTPSLLSLKKCGSFCPCGFAKGKYNPEGLRNQAEN